MGANSKSNSDRRAHARYRLHDVTCDSGSVIDISQSGIRLISDQLRRGAISLTLTPPDGKPFTVHATVEWNRSLGPCEYAIGLRFCKQYPEVNKLIARASKHDRVDAAPIEKTSRNALMLKYVITCLVLLTVPGLLAIVFSKTLALNSRPVFSQSLGPWEMPALFTIGGAFMVILLTLFLAANRAWKHFTRNRDVMALRRSTETLNTILDSSLGGVLVIEPIVAKKKIKDFQIKLINRAAEEYLSCHAGDVLGKQITKALPGLLDESLTNRLMETMQYGYPVREKQPISYGGRWFEIAAVLIGDAVAVTFVDRSEEQRHLDLLQRSAYYDVLTKLPNRKLLVENVQRELDNIKRQSRGGFAMLFIDMDGFKLINDGYGHDVGDAYLVEIADRLRGNLREEDISGRSRNNSRAIAHPARMGGDEFVVLLEQVVNPTDAMHIGERLLLALGEDITIDEHRFNATASIGVLMVSAEYKTVEAILRDADAAMYRAKTTGKGRCVLFDQNMRDKVFKQVALEKQVRRAIEESSFVLKYQPVLATDSQRVMSVDVAATWPHGSEGASSNVSFIQSLDAMSHTEALEQQFWDDLGDQLRAWQDVAPTRSELLIDLSISLKQLLHPRLDTYLQGLTDKLNRGPSGIRINIREFAVNQDFDTIQRVAGRLHEAGYVVALDNFGSELTPLVCLHKLPLQSVKISRDLIHSAFNHDDASRQTLKAVIQLAHALKLNPVAKGIDNAELLSFVTDLGCNRIEGEVTRDWTDTHKGPATADPSDSTNAA